MAVVYTPDYLASRGDEHGEQAAVIAWANKAADLCNFAAGWDAKTYSDREYALQWYRPRNLLAWKLCLLYAIPNGGQRSRVTATRLKTEGVKAGMPDLHLPVACGPYHGLFIEMKKKGGKTSDKQKDIIRQLRNEGMYCCVCDSWKDAVKVLETYLTQTNEYARLNLTT
jgi:hypothetical protein